MRVGYILFASTVYWTYPELTSKAGERVPFPAFLTGLSIPILSLSLTGGHVMAAFDNTIVDCRLEATHHYDFKRAISIFPGLTSILRVPLNDTLNLRDYPIERRHPLRYWPTIKRYLMLGHGPLVTDCLCTTLRILIDGGVPVPKTLYTPGQLESWLIRQGYPHVRKRSDPAGFRAAIADLCAD